MGSVLAETLGRQLLHSDIWFLADKCANLVKRIHEPLERSVAVLDNILTLEDEEANRTSNLAAAAPHPYQHHHRPRPREGINPAGGRQRVMDVGNIQEEVDGYFNRQFIGES